METNDLTVYDNGVEEQLANVFCQLLREKLAEYTTIEPEMRFDENFHILKIIGYKGGVFGMFQRKVLLLSVEIRYDSAMHPSTLQVRVQEPEDVLKQVFIEGYTKYAGAFGNVSPSFS